MRKRILSILLCLVMVVGLFPTMAFAAGGSGTASNPIVVTTFEELKAELEKDTVGLGMQYIKVPKGINIEKLLKLESYNSAFNVIRQKTLIVDGTVTVIAAAGTAAVRSMFSVHGPGNRLDIRGSGSLTFKANTNASCNAVVDVNDEGMLNVSGGVTLSGTFNTAVYGMAVYNYGGTVNIDNATLTGETAGVSYGAAVHANGGTTNIKNATLKSSVSPGANAISRKGSGTIFVGKDASLTIENSIIHTTDGVTDGHSIYLEKGSTKHIADYLGTNQKIYRQSDKVQLSADVTSLTDSVYITDDVSEKINAVSLTVGPLITREMISDLACSYSPSIKMTLTNFNVYNGLNNTTDKIEGENTPYDPNQSYTVMYVFRANEGFKFSTEATKNVTVTGGDFWMADTYGGTTNAIRVFVTFPASTIDKVSLTIKPENERTTISDLACSYSPAGGMTLTNFNVYKGLNNTTDKIEGENTPYDPNQSYTVMYVFRANEGFKFSTEATKNVTVTGGDFWMADTYGGTTNAIRVFVNFPREEVPHSITVTNGRGTANPTSAMAGETVTVKAKDDTANYMMFTQWYTDTHGVTFANATQQETTFVMPDCDVKVNPGFQQVSFTKQPVPQISLEKGYGGKTSFVFSWDISKWELVDTATNQTVSSDNTPVKAGKLTDVTIPANTDLGHKTYRIVVTTANGEQFKSNDFIVTWFEKMPAPLVEFNIPSGTKFIGEMTVNVGCPSTLETGGASPFETRYTTNGVDPKDADPSDIQSHDGYTDVTLANTTHFMARTILEGEGGNEDTWGELCEATYTMIDKLDAPTVTPESCSYSGSLPIIVTIQDVYNAEIDYTVKQHDGYSSGKNVAGPMLETRLPDTFCGTTTFRAKAIVYIGGGGAWESDEVTYTYTREYWANISNATISGKVNKAITATDVTITLDGEKFKNVAVGDDVSGWFNLPAGLTAKVKELNSLENGLTVTISGKPTATSAAAITVTIPKDKLYANNTADLTVLPNSKAYYSISTDADHTHDYTGQPYLYLDSGSHYQKCTAGDGYNILDHEFTPWTDNSDGTHSRHCTVCKMTDSSTYTETADHSWVFDHEDAPTFNSAGTRYYKCSAGCTATKTESIPQLKAITAVNVTVTAPVKGATPGTATPADTTYSVADTAWDPTVSSTFAGGTKYTVKVSLEANGNYRFTDKTTFQINGQTAKLDGAIPATGLDNTIITLTFPATEGGSTGGGGGGGVTTYPITVKSAKNGDVTASHKSASKGTAVTLTVDPDKGYVLDTLTVLDGKDKEIKLTEKNGKYTFTMPDSKVTVAATFKASAPTGKNPFIDVPAGSYYEDAVVWAVEKGITSGTSTVTFDPNGNCTRAQAVTFLWRAAGSPAPKTKVMPFTDVPSGSYYYDAVLWAMEQGITKGTSDTAFSPNASCTRAQIVTFLWRANGSPAVSGNSAFTDVAADAYYAAAVTWAEKNGVTGGIGGGLFGSNNNCTRAQIVTFIYRSVK